MRADERDRVIDFRNCNGQLQRCQPCLRGSMLMCQVYSKHHVRGNILLRSLYRYIYVPSNDATEDIYYINIFCIYVMYTNSGINIYILCRYSKIYKNTNINIIYFKYNTQLIII